MRKQWGMLNGEWGQCPPGSPCARVPHSPFPIPHSPTIPHSPPRGVTLIELLITMAIMAIISAAILGTASAAMEAARRTRTQSLVSKIHGLLTEQLASYETRRVEINSNITQALDNYVAMATSPADRAARLMAQGQIMADARLLGIRELMKMEMPDAEVDVIHVPLVVARVPSLTQGYRRRNVTRSDDNESAEFLYMVVMAATGDGEARTMFAKQDIGDVDEDGAAEFVDGWGQPLRWMRWPAGYVSDLQPRNANGTRVDRDPHDIFGRDRPPEGTAAVTPDVNIYPNVPAGTGKTFRQVYQENIRDRLTGPAPPEQKAAFRLVPLIYSIGPDEEATARFRSNDADAPLDPYFITPDGYQLGPDPESIAQWKDNITNHLIEY